MSDPSLLFKSIPRGQVPLDLFAGVRWTLPAGVLPGDWMEPIASLVPYRSGYHLHTRRQLVAAHLAGTPRVWLAEGRGACVDPGRDFLVFESARLVRELDWSLATRVRIALVTVREAFRYVEVEACVGEALAAAERLANPTVDALRAIDAQWLQPTFPKRPARWEEEIEDDPAGALRRRLASNRYLAASWAIAGSPPQAFVYARGAIGERRITDRLAETFESRVMDALFGR